MVLDITFGKNPIDFGAFWTNGGQGGPNPRLWFPRDNGRTVEDRAICVEVVLDITFGKNPIDFGAFWTNWGGWGG